MSGETLLNLFAFLRDVPGPLATMIIGTLPLAESRVAVPVAITVYGIHPLLAVIYATVGDIVPALLIIYTLGPVSGWIIRHSRLAERFFGWLFQRTRHKFVGHYEKYGLLGLFIFVAVPFPGTGSWSGAVAAFLFGIPKLKAYLCIIIGILCEAGIAALATVGGSALWQILF